MMAILNPMSAVVCAIKMWFSASSKLLVAGAAFLLVLSGFGQSPVAWAQLDRVYPVTGSAVTGSVTDINPDGIAITVGGASQNFRVDEIRKMTLEGDPGPLTRGRDLFLEGQYQSAVEQLRTVDAAATSREYIAADALFFRAASEAKLALAGQGNADGARASLLDFAKKHSKSIHFYPAAELLGDLAVTVGDYEGATRFYGALAKSASPALKMRASYLLALAAVRQGKADQAASEFDKVLAGTLDTSTAKRLKMLASAGRAVAKAKLGEGAAALESINELISQLNPADAEIAARVYNARGAANEALGDVEGAILDYLHTSLLFSSVGDAHAEALTRLAELWPKIGKPENAAAARQELQTRYPAWKG